MQNAVYDLKNFYNGKMGRMVRRVLQSRISEIWPEAKGLHLMGCGYAVPFLRAYKDQSERVTAIMPPEQGAFHWPHDQKNCVLLANSNQLPIENASVDRILLMHSLEFSNDPVGHLKELWRILKPNGRLLIIVPNRAGFWAHADWSPLGHGMPYSRTQIRAQLSQAQFLCERIEEALFMPPIKYTPFLKSAGLFEYIGTRYLSIAAGVHMVEASKQLYARIPPQSGNKAPSFSGAKGLFPPKPIGAR